MALVFREAHAAPDKKRINEEWFVLENAGATSVNTGGLQVIGGRPGKRGSVLGVIDPGFMLQPGEKSWSSRASPGRSRTASRPRARGCGPTTCSSARRYCTARGRCSAWR